jgi:mycothiol synthase
MPISRRSYTDCSDFNLIREMIRRAFAIDPDANAWSFAHFDIWSQRQVGREQVLHMTDWHTDVCLWEDNDALRGAALFDRDCSVLILDPTASGLAPVMLDWLEAHWTIHPSPRAPLLLEVFEGNTYLSSQLEKRGFQCETDFMYNRQKSLAGYQAEAVLLPDGYLLRHVETEEDTRRYIHAVKTVFGFEENIEVGKFVHSGPSAERALDLLIYSELGELAAFCNIWVDRQNSIAEFEPVGTLPEHQKRGLGVALLAEGCNRLQKMGIRTATVDSWSESSGANKLYEKAGFMSKRIYHTWEKPVSEHSRSIE